MCNCLALFLQTLQKEYDKLQDNLEVQKSEMTSLKDQLDNKIEECIALKQQVEALSQEHMLFEKTKSEIDFLKKEKENENLSKR